MDRAAIEAEISAQSKLVDSIPINQELVTEIDRYFKDTEYKLNQRLVYVPAKVIVQNFLPEIDKRGTLATKVDKDVWETLSFGKNWYDQKVTYEEISFDRHSKGFGFFYTIGEVTFDLGVVECDGVDWYALVTDDKRETHKLTGASVEIKLRASQHLGKLLEQINSQAVQIAESFRASLDRDAMARFPGMQIVGGLNRFFDSDPLSGNR